MKEQRNIITVVLLVLTLIFNFFFWREKLAANLAIFIILLAISALFLNKDSIKSASVLALLLSVLYSAGMVVYYNSVFSIFACISSFIVLAGLIHQPKLRTVISALFTSLGSFTLFPYNAIEEIRYNSRKYKYFSKFLKASKLAVLPLLIFTVFYSIYAYSNPIFNDFSNSFWDEVGKFLNQIFIDYPPERFILIFFGLFIVTGVLFNRGIKVFVKIDESMLNNLIRDKYAKLTSRIGIRTDHLKAFKKQFRFKMKSLLTEHKIGIILLVMVNLLILILNIIDISFVWFGFDSSEVDNLAYFVHEGTGYLIFSILLSIAILLFYFRGNLNFYAKNYIIKYLAYLWIVQNGIMAVSVMLRNYYYINYYYALSYKRIGVMIFLLLVFIGLITMLIKIHSKKTLFYLVKVNSTAVFIVMILMGSLGWDYQIAKFNLSNPDKNAIDVSYLFTLSDDVLPVLDENRNILDRDVLFEQNFRRYLQNGEIELKQRIREFMSKQAEYSWLSWNYADWKIENYFSHYNTERNNR